MTPLAGADWAVEPSLEDLERLFAAVVAIEPGPAPVIDLVAGPSRASGPGAEAPVPLARRRPATGPVPAVALAGTSLGAAPPVVGAVPRPRPGPARHLAPRPPGRQRAAGAARRLGRQLAGLWLWWSVPAAALVAWGTSKEAAAAGGGGGLVLAGAARLARAYRSRNQPSSARSQPFGPRASQGTWP